MSRSNARRLTAVELALLTAVLAVVAIEGQTPAPKDTRSWTPLRTAWGDPDFQGVWNYAAGTPLERPAEFNGKAVLTDDELTQAEKRARDRSNSDRRDGVGTDADVNREYNEFWFARRPAILTPRTSLITDPNGKLPALTPGADQRRVAMAPARADSWEDRTLSERCIIFPPNGPPILPSSLEVLLGQTFHFRILQSSGYVTMLFEAMQQLRIIPLDGRPHLPRAIQQWLGDSRGHWQGNTLVIETTNFHQKRAIAGFPAENMRVVERLTRTGPDTIDYEFTVVDPTTWTKPWTAAVPIEKTEGEIYESACHEGNYALLNILSGARFQERLAGEAATGRK